MTQKRVVSSTKHREAFTAFTDILAGLFVLGVGLMLWWFGAYFTLLALEKFGVSFAAIGDLKWSIPAGVSILELRYWPSAKQTQFKTLFLLLIGGFDLLSTAYGVYLWFPGKAIPLGAGYTMPKEGLALGIPVFLISFILTFGPERIIVWAAKEIRSQWTGA